MEDLNVKYTGLLNVMREAYDTEEGTDLQFNSPEFTGRIKGLLCLFKQYGVTKEYIFDEVLGDDWTWDHYRKTLEELKKLGAIDQFELVISPECDKIVAELEILETNK